MTPGIHLLHKPVGPTSFAFMQSAIETFGGRAGKQTICHGGTLDPFASGLLLILVEPATKLFDYLHAVPKVYEATVRWGVETDNGDPLGRIISEGDASRVSPARLDNLLRNFIGWHDQVPHATSAKRVAGERAYVRAHRGETLEMAPARVYLHEATWLSHDLPRESRLRIVCGGGYYVRALARDIGRQLGCGAHLSALHRVSIGPWNDPGENNHVEITGAEMLPWAARRDLMDQEVGELRRERAIELGTVELPTWSPPSGFPDPQAPIRGVHHNRLAYLLKPAAENQLAAINYLPI